MKKQRKKKRAKKYVYVTQSDISKGRPHSCRYCPVALAMTRRLRRNIVVYASGWAFGFPAAGTAARDLPTVVIDWIRRFDGLDPVAPIKFAI